MVSFVLVVTNDLSEHERADALTTIFQTGPTGTNFNVVPIHKGELWVLPEDMGEVHYPIIIEHVVYLVSARRTHVPKEMNRQTAVPR